MPGTTRVELDGGLEAAVEFYGSVFPDARLIEATLDDDAGPGTPRTLRVVRLALLDAELELVHSGPADPAPEPEGTEDAPEGAAADALATVTASDARAAERIRSGLREGGSAAADRVTDRFGVSWRLLIAEQAEDLPPVSPASDTMGS